ncbi:Embryo-specific [Trema orientale]|uniref:Embryo-specific n=1 Tax=Trema orientale TaxID=63057 RepID=A0A2P5F147_TREOI|nr:Embryo-specific [Trema orientale]
MLSFSTISLITLLISFLVNAIQFQRTNQAFLGPQRNCSYSIEIETTCAPSAETRDRVSVRFTDAKGNLIIVKHLKNPKLLYAPKNGSKRRGGVYSGFGRCAIDMFEASGLCVSDKVCSLYLKKFGSDEWRPGWVKVHQQEGGHVVHDSYMFYFRTFVPENVWYGFNYCHSKGSYVPVVDSFGED